MGSQTHVSTVFCPSHNSFTAQTLSIWLCSQSAPWPPHTLTHPHPTLRGFHVAYIREDTLLPEHVDPETGAVRCALRPCHRFRIQFDARGPRDDIKVRSGWEAVFWGQGYLNKAICEPNSTVQCLLFPVITHVHTQTPASPPAISVPAAAVPRHQPTQPLTRVSASCVAPAHPICVLYCAGAGNCCAHD